MCMLSSSWLILMNLPHNLLTSNTANLSNLFCYKNNRDQVKIQKVKTEYLLASIIWIIQDIYLQILIENNIFYVFVDG